MISHSDAPMERAYETQNCCLGMQLDFETQTRVKFPQALLIFSLLFSTTSFLCCYKRQPCVILMMHLW